MISNTLNSEQAHEGMSPNSVDEPKSAAVQAWLLSSPAGYAASIAIAETTLYDPVCNKANLVRLRSLHSHDIFDLVKSANDRRVWINLRNIFPQPYTYEDGMAWIDLCFAQASRHFLDIALFY